MLLLGLFQPPITDGDGDFVRVGIEIRQLARIHMYGTSCWAISKVKDYP